ncbi:hypothetical protein FIA58_013220 [Flavobacterium jejuense]|uniref:Disease resistance R13L4/SHOC-2-like LRR domain-containing protein n=1 Tax=Flavobacterium jejuense TaxID=1544455 RepID=A0ABX0IY14_9FLAO|nr:hypothetical protein [Flavobacterium jejuense]NHN26640.1 hypothetical protein [Flavobacterium jejuense]
METQEQRIDLAKETFNFSEIQNLHEIKEIRFDNCTEKFEIPLTINDYPNITKLSFHSASRENTYEVPENLDQLKHIKHLTLWSFCNFNSLKEMLHIESLHTVVQNTKADTQKLVKLFPNVKELEIWGSHLKKEQLPDEIGNLTHLESIDLISCGLKTLPDSFKNLKNLKKIGLAGLPMNIFPEILTDLENLESLEINTTLAKIPDSLSKLKKLKQLNLWGSLNEGRMEITRKGDENLYLRPIPEAIGKLENLEELDLSTCGVFDITPITPLKKLKKLTLRYSALKNCEGFSNFTHLEELNLETSYDLKNLEGLKGLPIKKLNLSSNYYKSIEVISFLELLESLDIKNCRYIKDYTPIYNHPTIKELKANDEILKNWKNKDKFKTLPAIDVLITQLETNDVLKFEEAILQLSKHIKLNFNNKKNPLASYFNLKAKEEKITEIKILDQAIQKHIKNLSDTCLTTIFGMTFKSAYDNYNATLLVLEEIISRKNKSTQKKIVKQFYKACEYYDAGHRYWGCTVQDQLIDNFFSQFTSEALYQLLKKASTDMLNSDGGDQMEDLFMPAFQNTTDFNVQKKLLKVFFKYEEEDRAYFGKDYFDALLSQIQAVALPEIKEFLTETKEKNKLQETLISDLENLNTENLPKIIALLGNGISKKLEEEYLYNIVKAIQKNTLDEKSITQCLSFLSHKEKASYMAQILGSKYHETNPEKIVLYFDNWIAENNSEKTKDLISEVIRLLIQDLDRIENYSFKDLEVYRNYAVNVCKEAISEIYSGEVRNLLSFYFDRRLSNHQKKNNSNWVLEKITAIFNHSENQFSYNNLYYDTYYLVSDDKNEQCRTVFNYLSPRMTNYSDEDILYLNVIAAIKLNDASYFDLLLKEVQKLEEITKVLLAFNLACGFAHFERKEEMIFHIKESIRLGKTKQQFLDDTDFEKFWDDDDFLNAIEEE